jgi:hypothetical protein
MKWTTTAILVVFGAFIILLIVSPNLSCFGRRIKSPFYPLLRKRKGKSGAAGDGDKTQKKTEDYGFH